MDSRFHLIAFAIFALIAAPLHADTRAKTIFEENRKHVYQIRVIDNASGDKYSIGSGYQVTDTGFIATNFHVVSSYVHEPEKYQLQLSTEGDETADLELLAIDVVHDLAIVQWETTEPGFLPIRTEPLKNGDKIYSMGNPHDLGMTIVEGNYNGLVQNSRYQNILFSGSLNPGMSGGPTFDSNGEVIGTNVSKGGEQLSFLVPAEHLAALIERARADNNAPFAEQIQQSLLADQEAFFTQLLNSDVEKKTIGKLEVFGKLVDSLNCWGHTVEADDDKFEAVHQHCNSEDSVYVSDELQVGSFAYNYEWITTSELNRWQFYNYVEGRFDPSYLGNSYEEDEITEFTCSTAFIALPPGDWKIATCLRAYKKYAGLYDAVMVMGSIAENNEAAIAEMSVTAASKENALAFIQRMVEEVRWIQ